MLWNQHFDSVCTQTRTLSQLNAASTNSDIVLCQSTHVLSPAQAGSNTSAHTNMVRLHMLILTLTEHVSDGSCAVVGLTISDSNAAVNSDRASHASKASGWRQSLLVTLSSHVECKIGTQRPPARTNTNIKQQIAGE